MMLAIGLVLLAAVALAWWRMWRALAGPARSWRFRALMALQPLAAGLFWLVLFPPPGPDGAETLVVATAGAPGLLDAASVVLPEAKARGGRPMPDLGTALRATGARRIRVLGSGLEARDLEVSRSVEVMFRPPLPPPGVAALAVEGPVAVGLPLQVVGRAFGTAGGRVELLDPAGEVAARQALASDGRFALQGSVRAAGPTEWQVRLLDSAGALKEQLPLPVWVPPVTPVRLLVLAGAPGPEIKFLRRWATDAGMPVSTRILVGGGVVLGDQPARPMRDALAQTDALVLDERSWAELTQSDRQAVLVAARAGLGLVLRVTGPIPEAVRRDWQAIGPAVIGEEAVPRRLGGAAAVASLPLQLTPADVVIARDDGGAALAAWRALGRGRVAIWPVQDGQALVLAGDAARFEALWSGVLAAVARSAGVQTPGQIVGFVGERLTLCPSLPVGKPGAARLLDPDGQMAPLLLDATGCAAVWPRTAGWFMLMVDDRPPHFLRVLPASAWPGVRAAQRSMKTQALAKAALGQASAAAPIEGAPMPAPAGAPWVWLSLLLTLLAAMWWLERSGRRPFVDKADLG